MKKCNICKTKKEAKDFYTSKLAKDGLHSRCIECHKRIQNKQRQDKRDNTTTSPLKKNYEKITITSLMVSSLMCTASVFTGMPTGGAIAAFFIAFAFCFVSMFMSEDSEELKKLKQDFEKIIYSEKERLNKINLMIRKHEVDLSDEKKEVKETLRVLKIIHKKL